MISMQRRRWALVISLVVVSGFWLVRHHYSPANPEVYFTAQRAQELTSFAEKMVSDRHLLSLSVRRRSPRISRVGTDGDDGVNWTTETAVFLARTRFDGLLFVRSGSTLRFGYRWLRWTTVYSYLPFETRRPERSILLYGRWVVSREGS